MTPEDEVRQTLTRYAYCHDDRDAAGYAALFAENGSFVGANGEAIAGRAAVSAFISKLYATQPANRRTKHLCGNSLIAVNGDTAAATTDFVAYESLGDAPWQVHTIGRYHDKLVRQAGSWLFVERKVIATRQH